MGGASRGCRPPRREGDPAALVADNRKITAALDWRPRYDDLDYIVRTAWDWEQALARRTAGEGR